MEPKNTATPESLKSLVHRRVTEGGDCSASESVRDLIRADQKRQTEERIDALLVEGLHSGAPIEISPEFWEARRQKLSARLTRKPTP
ncbi:ribbon-helix-helix domain-containing protein [Tautonia marina]|uniref:ribbon-helix-helix domain-containing protein n=1 Tax=Tautonia marina TaxID=2653855 RepID=UPI001260C0DC|nr:type II toxin-antitoxin system ParD family antitoxin [Tautonia marina]